MAYRKSVHKGRSARSFRKNIARGKEINFRANPMRGGIRM